MIFSAENAVFGLPMGNIPDANMRPKCANMCHYDANIVQYGAIFVHSGAKFVPNETADYADFRIEKEINHRGRRNGKFESRISKYETNSNFQRP